MRKLLVIEPDDIMAQSLCVEITLPSIIEYMLIISIKLFISSFRR